MVTMFVGGSMHRKQLDVDPSLKQFHADPEDGSPRELYRLEHWQTIQPGPRSLLSGAPMPEVALTPFFCLSTLQAMEVDRLAAPLLDKQPSP